MLLTNEQLENKIKNQGDLLEELEFHLAQLEEEQEQMMMITFDRNHNKKQITNTKNFIKEVKATLSDLNHAKAIREM